MQWAPLPRYHAVSVEQGDFHHFMSPDPFLSLFIKLQVEVGFVTGGSTSTLDISSK